MDITNKQIKVTFNNGAIKYATISEIRVGLPKSNSYPIKYEIQENG